jgi:FKBP-type peptidyl-prolyl cis-trans isomerase 2
MTQIKEGDTIQVRYAGRLANRNVLDNSTDRKALEFTVGEGTVVPGLEQAVVGMEPGEEKTVEIPAEQAYGPWREEKVITIDRARLPDNIEPQVGRRLVLQQLGGRGVPVLVTGMTEFAVRFDANHPLAGKDLVIDIEIVEITHHVETPQEDTEDHAQDENTQSNGETLPDHTQGEGQETQAR